MATAVVQFTVAIRAYNAADRLPALLEALLAQTQVEHLAWEVLVVDNCSCDNTADLVARYQQRWPASFGLRYCLEPRQGALFARQRAMAEAQGEWVGFLDDDNLPQADWVAAAWAFGQAYPKAGAFGSQIHGQFEVEPPQNFERIAHFLPVIERDKLVCFTQGLYARKQVLPPGAGLVIRKRAWEETVPDKLLLSGPVAQGLAAKGEDIEALTHIKRAGWEIWFNPEMHITHLIPKWRFERDYLQRFFQGVGRGRFHTRMLGLSPWLRPPMTLAYFLNDLRKLLAHRKKYAHLLATDTVVACEQALFRSSLASPFYHLGRRLGRPWGLVND